MRQLNDRPPLARQGRHQTPPARSRQRAQAGRHPIALAGWLLLSAGAIGLAAVVMRAMPFALRTPLAFTVVTALLLLTLGRTALYPIAAWSLFALTVYDDGVLVRELRGPRVCVHFYPVQSTELAIERLPWDYLLGTGTVLLHGAEGVRRYHLLTPVTGFDRGNGSPE